MEVALVVAGRIEVPADRHDDAAAAMVTMAAATREEAGNISYVFSADLVERGVFHIFEEWASQEALDEHFLTPHMATFQQASGEIGRIAASVQKYDIRSVGPVR